MATATHARPTISISANRLSSLLSEMYPNPDDPGPYDPRIDPNPVPWVLASKAAELVLIARALEVGGKGGSTFMSAVLEDPDDWCGTGRPHIPKPKKLTGDELITLGAAFVHLSDTIREGELGNQVRQGGQALMERGASMGN